MKHAPVALLASVILLGSCSRVTRVEGPSPAGAEPASAAGTARTVAAPEAQNRPWYAERFEALGFYVFPEPTDIPVFEVRPRSGGSSVGPADFRGKITLLNFWATWCPPCRQEMPSIESLHKIMTGEAFAVAAVSVKETPETVEAFLRQNPYTFPIYLDPTGAASGGFVSRGIPTTFVLDKNARAIAAIIGSRSYDEPEVTELFKELAKR